MGFNPALSRLSALALFVGGTMSCASERYAGVNLSRSALPTEIQTLARKSRNGDKASQLALGERYERGDGVARDLDRAAAMYRASATDSGGTRMVLVPHRGGTLSTVPVSNGKTVPGLAAARTRLWHITNKIAVANNRVRNLPEGNFQAEDRHTVDHIKFQLAWLEAGVEDFNGVSRCEIGNNVTTQQCRPTKRVQTHFKKMTALYMSQPVTSLDGKLGCHGIVCTTWDSSRVVIEIEKSECVKSRLAVLIKQSKYPVVRVFCQKPSGLSEATDYIDQSILSQKLDSINQILGIFERLQNERR